MQRTIPTPPAQGSTAAQLPPAKLDFHESARIRAAIAAAPKLYQGAVAKLIVQTLTDYVEFAHRVHQSSLPAELVRDILAQQPQR